MLRRIAEHYALIFYIFDLDKSSFSSVSAIFSSVLYNLIQILIGYRQMARHMVLIHAFVGSTPTSPVCLYRRQRLFVSFLPLFEIV